MTQLLLPTGLCLYSEHFFMQVFVNNKLCELADGATIAAMLEACGVVSRSGIALAVNSDVVARENWGLYKLKENDKIMIIKATQGG